MTEEGFPVADVTEKTRPRFTRISRMWWITLACIAVAVYLTWKSIDATGPEIVVLFPDGHGLKPGDSIRHRGIEIGRVESVKLNPSLEGIVVTAMLDPDAAVVACEGSRFWIVRPQLDLTGVRGLETAVGAKYIAVLPGGSGQAKTEFEGLAMEPPGSLGRGGIEIILRGDHRWGVNPGSPLTWRGVEVGQVLSSSLSPDALHVDTRVRVLDNYRRLLSRDSKFWVTSGVHVGMDGLKFQVSADSLATIARGGVAFITPGRPAETDAVRPGDVFTLHEDEDERWTEGATATNLLRHSPPPIATLTATWKEKVLGIPRTRRMRSSGLTIQSDNGPEVLLPSDLLEPAEESKDTYALEYSWENESRTLRVESRPEPVGEISRVALGPGNTKSASILSGDRMRSPAAPEDCFAIRNSWHSEGDTIVVIEMISQSQLTQRDSHWRCDNEKLSRDVWHGATVIASEDEKVIGMLVVSDDAAKVVPLFNTAF